MAIQRSGLPEPPPGLTDAIVAELAASLDATADSWIRAEFPHDWPIGAALAALVVHRLPLRVGVLRPFGIAHVANVPQAVVSGDPSEITRWRGEALEERRAWHTVVLGDARGRLEAGLQSVLRVPTHTDVLRRWAEMLVAWTEEAIHSRTPQPLLRELIQLAIDGQVDANAVDEYIGDAAGGDEEQYLDKLRALLWYLDLFPDHHVLDSGRAAARLDRNFFVKRLLLSATDTPAELTRLRRLEDAAEQGDSAARGALDYRATRDRSALEGVELEAILRIIEPPRRRPIEPPEPRPFDLFQFLDASAAAERSEIEAVLAALHGDWDLDAREEIELLAEFGNRNVRVVVTPVPPEGNPWLGSGEFADQKVAFMGGEDADRDWLRFVGTPVSGSMLLDRARAQDEFLGGTRFETLVSEYLEARAGLVRFERWLRESALELLLLSEDARGAVSRFLGGWHELIDAASETQGGAELLRKELALLEAVWGAPTQTPEDFLWCACGPLHPYLLEPLLTLVTATLDDLAVPELGSKLEWAFERAIPAFSVTWGLGKTFFLARRGDVFVFETVPPSVRPATRSGDGLYQLARAFMGYHPYGERGLVITLIDPPKGGAIQKNLRRIEQSTKNLRVYLVTTRGDSAQLEELGETVRNLGRFESLEEWLRRSPVTSHLLVYFAPRPAAGAAPAPADWGPTSGAHVALQVQLRSGGLFGHGLSPSVTFEPRSSNRAVVSLQRLAAPEIGSPDLFQIHPMLSTDAAQALVGVAEHTEWLVVGAPSPLGLVAPREIGESLNYLGREPLGAYGLFAYATALFAVRKYVTEEFRDLPLLPNADEVEARLTDLAVRSPNGVLRIGGTQGKTLWEQVGVMVATTMSRALDG
jgi:hypothetical protein